jgi:hypothetical protein
MKNLRIALTFLLLLVGITATAQPIEDDAKPAQAETQEAKDQAIIKAQLPSYPLDGCAISGKKFTKEAPAVDVVVDGRLIRVCCGRCEKKVQADATASIAKIDAAVISAQKPLWPLKACPISGEAMGSMGDPIDMVVGTRYVQLCCKGCIRGVKKDTTKFLAKLDTKLIPELVKTYPGKTCAVSGEELGSMGDTVNMMYGHRLVRLCCKGCLRGYNKNPAATVAKIYTK